MNNLKNILVVLLGIATVESLFWSKAVKQTGIHTFYSREGTQIKDPAQLSVLNLELRKLLPKKELRSNLKITTTISQKQSDNYLLISAKYKQNLLHSLQSGYPEHRSFLDSLYKTGRLSNISILVLNNLTGEVENCHFNYSEKALFDPNLEHRATDPYGYIMTFDKGKKLYDTFRVDPKASSIFQIPGPITILRSFTLIPGGNIMSHPYDYYPLSEWEALKKKLDLDLDFSKYRPGRFSGIRTSLFDLVKMMGMIQNNGEDLKPVFIRKVKNSGNENIYSYQKAPGKKVLSKHVVQNMKELFKYYMTKGPGSIHYRKNAIREDCMLFSGGRGESQNWLIYTNEQYTFGLVEYNILQSAEYDYYIRRREKFKLSSMMKDLLSGMHLNRVKGQNIKAIENSHAEESITCSLVSRI